MLAASPRTRPALADRRITTLTWRQVGYQVTVRIPAGTVLWEEVAFRAVLLAALRRVWPGPSAAAVAGGLFGLWHIRPTVAALRVNQVTAGPRATVAAVTAAVAGTAAAGVALGWLRDRSGSLAAPVLVHLAANCGAALAARAAAGPDAGLWLGPGARAPRWEEAFPPVRATGLRQRVTKRLRSAGRRASAGAADPEEHRREPEGVPLMPPDQGARILRPEGVTRAHEELHVPAAVERQVAPACLRLTFRDQAPRTRACRRWSGRSSVPHGSTRP